MVSATCALFLLSAVMFLAVVLRHSGAVRAELPGMPAAMVASLRARVKAYYACFAAAAVSASGVLLAAIGSQFSDAVMGVIPALLVLAGAMAAVAAAALAWSWWPAKKA